MKGLTVLAFVLLAGATSSCARTDQQRLLDHIKVLSSDEYEGRGPGTKGEELTVRYLVDLVGPFYLDPLKALVFRKVCVSGKVVPDVLRGRTDRQQGDEQCHSD